MKGIEKDSGQVSEDCAEGLASFDSDLQALIEDELLMLRHSGEIPEIALHQSIYFLCEDPDGPRLSSIPYEALSLMKRAVFERYRVICLRDLKPENRDLSIYRGVVRSIMNYRRLVRFCKLEGIDYSEVTGEIARFLRDFLQQEVEDVVSGRRKSCINCTYRDLLGFVQALGMDPGDLPEGIEDICPEKGAYDS